MGGFIILEDGRAWAAANWAYDAAVRYVASALSHMNTSDSLPLSAWLLEQTNEVRGSGMGYVDLRELTDTNRRLFREAARNVYATLKQNPPNDWSDPTFFPSWLERFRDLLRLIKSVDRRDNPEDFNPHMRGLIEPTGLQSGPGWPELRSDGA